MSVRKITSDVRLDHRVYSSSASGCFFWPFRGLFPPPETPPEPERGAIQFWVGDNWWVSTAKFTAEEYLEFGKKVPSARVLGNAGARGQLVKFHSEWYWADSDLDEPDIDALLKARDMRKKQSVERAKSLAALEDIPSRPVARGAIPEVLRTLIWQRDGGACAKCGSTVELQFDHIIPVALGGATSEQNLQVLCGPCNRKKGASIT